ncbi:MAG: A/G-specific adenine glycosylase, partial [Planctomycetota bacterium]
MTLPSATRGALRRRLLAWYRREARDLPFRRTRDPYRIWLAEILLQQTRMEAGVPYYERFVARFPDVAALAAAGVDAVLALWEGLGYYNRARNLHRAARIVV